MRFTRQFADELARKAAKAYIEDDTALTDAVADLATVYDLNQEQIKRVCEAANLITKDLLNDPKAIFDLADSKVVINRLQPDMSEETQKEAAMSNRGSTATLDGSVNAILGDEKCLDAFDRQSRPASVKVASEKIAQNQGSAVRTLYDGFGRLLEKTSAQLNSMEMRAEESTISFINALVKEGNDRGSIDRSYSSMLKIAADSTERMRIRAIYRRAFDKIAADKRWGRTVTPLREVKVAAYVDRDAPIAQDLKKLMKISAEMDVKKRVIEKISQKRDDIKNRMLRCNSGKRA